jgi:CheY-like chemotaxis protein
VDDSVNNRAVIEDYLRFCDAGIETCLDGRSSLARLEELRQRGETCHGLLIDQHLADMDGLDLAQAIRERYGAAAPDSILLTSTAVAKARLRRSGVLTTLRKPVRQLELYSCLAQPAASVRWPMHQSERREMGRLFHDLRGSVLLVDDEPINQMIARAILEKFGLRTEVTASGEEAVRLTAQKDYSVVLMDIQMPEMSGYEATELIRRREKEQGGRQSVIIAMTANAMESTKKRCLEVGMDDFFTKPIKPEVLAARLLPWLSTGSEVAEKGSDRKNGAGHEPVVSTGRLIWDPDTALGFAGGDKELFRELVELFVKRNDSLLTNIDDAVRSGDAVALRECAHAYKGAVSHFAAEEPRQLAMTLEDMGKSGVTDGSEEIFRRLRAAVSRLIEELNEYLASSSA